MKSLPFPPSDQVRRARWYVLPCNHLILAKSTVNLTVWYLTPWLVHSLNYSHTHTHGMSTFIEGEKEEVAHQVITKNTHSAISFCQIFKELGRRESLEKLC